MQEKVCRTKILNVAELRSRVRHPWDELVQYMIYAEMCLWRAHLLPWVEAEDILQLKSKLNASNAI